MFKTEEADYVSVIVKSCVQRVNWSERPGDTYRTAAGNNENTRLNILLRGIICKSGEIGSRRVYSPVS